MLTAGTVYARGPQSRCPAGFRVLLVQYWCAEKLHTLSNSPKRFGWWCGTSKRWWETVFFWLTVELECSDVTCWNPIPPRGMPAPHIVSVQYKRGQSAVKHQLQCFLTNRWVTKQQRSCRGIYGLMEVEREPDRKLWSWTPRLIEFGLTLWDALLMGDSGRRALRWRAFLIWWCCPFLFSSVVCICCDLILLLISGHICAVTLVHVHVKYSRGFYSNTKRFKRRTQSRDLKLSYSGRVSSQQVSFSSFSPRKTSKFPSRWASEGRRGETG